jgi:hypothetical protein
MKKNVHCPVLATPSFKCRFLNDFNITRLVGDGKQTKWRKIVDNNLYSVT